MEPGHPLLTMALIKLYGNKASHFQYLYIVMGVFKHQILLLIKKLN